MNLVCESVQEFLKLNENMELAKQAFQKAGYNENSVEWKDFIEVFGKDANYLEKFSEWVLTGNKNAFRYLSQAYYRLKKMNIDLNPNTFTSLDDYIFNANEEIDKAREEEKEQIIKRGEEERSNIIKRGEEERAEIDKMIKDANYAINRLGLFRESNVGRGIYTTKLSHESLERNERGQGLYIWTDLPFLYNWNNDPKTLKINFKFGQYGARSSKEVLTSLEKDVDKENKELEKIHSEVGKKASETISGYSGIYLSPKVILHIRNLNEYLKTSDKKYNDAIAVEKAVQTALKKKGWHNEEILKSTEVFAGGTLQDLIETIEEVLTGSNKKNLIPKNEQREGFSKITNYFSNPENKEFLLAAKMRYGKNITVLNAIKELNEKFPNSYYRNNLVISYKPQVFASLKEDIDKFSQFSNFELVDIRKEKNITEKSDKVRIFVSSAQYALYGSKDDVNESKIENEIYTLTPDEEVEALQQTAYDDFEKNIDKLKKIHFGIIMADEYHYGTKSHKFRQLLKELSYEKIIYVSGTAMKDLATGKFDDNQMYNWTYIDEQKQREKEILEYKRDPDKYYPNIDMPKMHFYKMDISEEAKRLANESGVYTPEEGFSFNKCFNVDKEGKLVNEQLVKILLEQIVGNDSTMSIHSDGVKGNLNHTFWVMPKNIKKIKAVANFMRSDSMKNVFKNYNIIEATGDLNNDINKVKNKIREAENKGKKSITLTCYRFKEGTTVPEWGAVVMLDDGKSPEEYLQAIFRCQSPGGKDSKGWPLKENCYVFDYNPERFTVLYHDIAQWSSKTGKEGEYEITKQFLKYAPVLQSDKNTMVEVDADEIIKSFHTNASFKEQMANESVFNEEYIDKILDDDLLEDFSGISSKKGASKVTINDQGLSTEVKNQKTSKELKTDRIEDEDAEDSNGNLLEKQKEKIRNFLRTLPTFLFASKTEEKTIEDIVKTSEIDLFEEICGLSPEILGKLVERKILSIKQLNEKIEYFRRLVNELNENPSVENIERFINKHMVIRAEEGSTPAALVNEMLDKLPKETWSDKNKKFCDPCMGMGKFLLGIKERLMEGLKGIIPNENERERHIIEEMLYGVDISRAKTYMTESLINSKGFKSHLLNKDSLNLDWNNMPKFDVVVGNPPYQYGKDKLFYIKFLKLSYNISKELMLFITPASIFTTRVKFYEDLKNKFSYINLDPLINKTYFEGIGLGSLFSYYVIDKTKTNYDVQVNFGNEEKILNLNTLKYNILDERNYDSNLDSIFEKIYKNGILEKHSGKGDFIIHKEDASHIFKKERDSEFKYPAYLSSKEDRKNVFSRERGEAYGIPKLAVSLIIEPKRADRFSEFNIDKGVGRYSIYFIVKNEAEAKNIQQFFNSDLYKFIDNKKRFGRYAFLNIPNLDFKKTWTNKQLYEYFNLTEKEINYIESQIK